MRSGRDRLKVSYKLESLKVIAWRHILKMVIARKPPFVWKTCGSRRVFPFGMRTRISAKKARKSSGPIFG